MEIINDWYKKDTPSFCLLYRGPVCDPLFGYNIMSGSYDKDMKPEVLSYYKDYFTKNPPHIDKELKEKLDRLNEGMKECEICDCPIWMNGYCTSEEWVIDMICKKKK